MRYSLLLFFFAVFLMIGCKNKNKESNNSPQQITDTTPASPSTAQLFLKEIEKTHRSEDFKSREAITFEVRYKSEKPTKKFRLQTDLKKIKMTLPNKDFVLLNNGELYTSPDLPDQSLAEFKNIIQLFGLAFHSEDWSSEAQEKGQDSLQGKIYTTVKLNLKNTKFLAPTTDLKVYSAPLTGFISAVTFSNKTSAENHLVLYKDYFSLGRIPFPKHWEIYREAISETNLIDKLSIARLKFFQPPEDFFNPPSHAVLLD